MAVRTSEASLSCIERSDGEVGPSWRDKPRTIGAYLLIGLRVIQQSCRVVMSYACANELTSGCALAHLRTDIANVCLDLCR